MAESYAMVFLVESGFAQQTEVACAFDRSERSVRRYQERYAQGGMSALGRAVGWRHGRRRIRGKRLRGIEVLKSQGLSNRAIAQRLGVSERAIRKLVGPSKSVEPEQLDLVAIGSAAASEAPQTPVPPATSSDEDTNPQGPPLANDQAGDSDDAGAQDEPVPMSLDRDAGDRSLDRQVQGRSEQEPGRQARQSAHGKIAGSKPGFCVLVEAVSHHRDLDLSDRAQSPRCRANYA